MTIPPRSEQLDSFTCEHPSYLSLEEPFQYTSIKDPALKESVLRTITHDQALSGRTTFYYKDITCLQFYNKGLTELPDELRKFPNLEKLHLSGNYLKKLPDWIKEFTALHELNASNNNLAEFPSLPPHLQDLYLGNNQLTQIPSLSGTKIKNLGLENNKIKSFPDDPLPPTLEMANLSRNRIEALPDKMEGLVNLWRLEMNYNQLTSLPNALSRAPLINLSLIDNALTTVPAAIKTMKSLKNLQLQDNQIEVVPKWVETLPSLRSLGIKGNSVSLTQLQDLNIYYIDLRDQDRILKMPRDGNALSA